MHLKHLSLTNYRNYGRLELDLPLGTILLHGHNAQGKTNILEAVYYLATTRSPFARHDQQLIHWHADQAEDPIVVGRLVAEIGTNAGSQYSELRLIKEQKNALQAKTFRREALINRRKVRLMDLLGTLRVVLFLPEDIEIITGSPANRRRYLDILICQIDQTYCRTLSAYNKVLEQRNALLKQIAKNRNGQDVLPIYTEELVKLGSQLFIKRATHLQTIAHQTQRIHYEYLTNKQESIRLDYLPCLSQESSNALQGTVDNDSGILAQWLQENTLASVQERFHQTLTSAEQQDGLPLNTTIGPHRDDWCFWLNGRALQAYGSRGQQRSAMLALKLAEIEWIYAETDEMPILLLDEVLAELDQERRTLLLNVVQQAQQAILTATETTMFSSDFLENTCLFYVQNGRISKQSSSVSPILP